jgi:hypothetical protein
VSQKEPIISDTIKEEKVVEEKVVKIDFDKAVYEFAKNIKTNGKGVLATRHRVTYLEEEKETCKALVELQIFVEKTAVEDGFLEEIDALVKEQFLKITEGRSFWNGDRKVIEASIEYNIGAAELRENNRDNRNERIEANDPQGYKEHNRSIQVLGYRSDNFGS